MPIYVIGESHTDLYSSLRRIILPAFTMHRIGRDGINHAIQRATSGSHYKLVPDDILLVVLGEIDIRCHIWTQIYEKKRDEDEVIRDLANRFIASVVAYATENRVRIIIRGIVPPLIEGEHHDISYPIRGTLVDRCRWRNTLNKLIENLCSDHGLLFIASPQWAENEDGTMVYEESDGIIHIHSRNAPRATSDLLTFLAQSKIQ